MMLHVFFEPGVEAAARGQQSAPTQTQSVEATSLTGILNNCEFNPFLSSKSPNPKP